MPELPEVQTIVDHLAPTVTGATVIAALAEPGPRWCDAALAVGACLGTPRRRGKWILVPMSTGRELVVHLGMTGALRSSAAPMLLQRPTRAVWSLTDVDGWSSALRLDDVRGFGRIAVVDAGDYSKLPGLASLGPEPLAVDFDPSGPVARLCTANTPVKGLLLDQTVLAGVGNIYADEALFAAGVHPCDRHLSLERAARLVDQVRAVLRRGVANGGTTLRDYRRPDGSSGSNQGHLAVYGRACQPCPVCATLLERVTVTGRTSTFCPRCQPLDGLAT